MCLKVLFHNISFAPRRTFKGQFYIFIYSKLKTTFSKRKLLNIVGDDDDDGGGKWPDVGGDQERNRASLPSLAEERSKSRLFLHWWQRFLMVGIISFTFPWTRCYAIHVKYLFIFIQVNIIFSYRFLPQILLYRLITHPPRDRQLTRECLEFN